MGCWLHKKQPRIFSVFLFLNWPLPTARGLKPGSKSVIPKPSFGTHKDVSNDFEESQKFSKYFIFIYSLFQNEICPQGNIEKVAVQPRLSQKYYPACWPLADIAGSMLSADSHETLPLMRWDF